MPSQWTPLAVLALPLGFTLLLDFAPITQIISVFLSVSIACLFAGVQLAMGESPAGRGHQPVIDPEDPLAQHAASARSAGAVAGQGASVYRCLSIFCISTFGLSMMLLAPIVVIVMLREAGDLFDELGGGEPTKHWRQQPQQSQASPGSLLQSLRREELKRSEAQREAEALDALFAKRGETTVGDAAALQAARSAVAALEAASATNVSTVIPPDASDVRWEAISAEQGRAAAAEAAAAATAARHVPLAAAAPPSAPVEAAPPADAPRREWVQEPAAPRVAEDSAAARCPVTSSLCAAGRPLEGDASPARRDAVRDAMLHAWRAYEAFAWGEDELEPLTQTGNNGGYRMALTMVDSLDTLLILGLDAEFGRAASWVEQNLKFGHQEGINVFEVTIRVLGGLLSAYEISGNQAMLHKADELAQQLLFAFNTPTGLPMGTVGLRTKTATNPSWAKGASTVAEVASLQLEYRSLSRHTKNAAYEAVAQRVMHHLRTMARPDTLPRGLYPTFIDPKSGEFANADVTLGARADSLYEYLLKQWLLSEKSDTRVRAMYEESVDAIDAFLVSSGGEKRCANCTFLRQWNHRTKAYQDKMDHLICFVPGMLALGAHGESARHHLALAERLMHTCYRMYADQPTGLAPEIAIVGAGDAVRADGGARHNLLRPETVESLLVLWRVTRNPLYREWGWNIFQSFEKHCRVRGGGYSGLKDVTVQGTPAMSGKMESFFTAETVKYLWLLFADSAIVPLDEWVFNTEAHPLRVHPDYRWGARWGSLPDLDANGDVDRARLDGLDFDQVEASAIELADIRDYTRNREATLRLVAQGRSDLTAHAR